MKTSLVSLSCFVVLFLILIKGCAAKGSRHDIRLSYVCNSDDWVDLSFTGEDCQNIRYGIGVCGYQSINVNFTSGFHHGTLSGCDKNMDIYLYLYDYKPVLINMALPIQTYVLQCNTKNTIISAVLERDDVKITRSSRALKSTDTALIMELVNRTGPISLGEQYTLRISGQKHFTIFPESCKASSDQYFLHEVTLMENGCTIDKTILTRFHKHDILSAVEATIHGFHLVYSDSVFIKCTVKMCLSTQCEIKPTNFIDSDCNTYGYVNNIIPTINITETSKSVITSFRVIDPALNHASSSAGGFSFVTPGLCLLMFVTYILSQY